MRKEFFADPFAARGILAAGGEQWLNTAFPRIAERAERLPLPGRRGLRMTLVGLGDVGGTLLTALKLLADEVEQIGIYDPFEPLIDRYEAELGQVLERDAPRIVRCAPEALFDCDLFLFAGTKGVPPVGAQGDMRMQQFQSNRELARHYARQARASGFSGLFCQISDPVDLLCRCVYLQSNRDEQGRWDWQGLLPEQVVGFGLGVMAARARYYARKTGLDAEQVAVYGPHGAGLVAANDPQAYDEAASAVLTEQTVTANHAIRALGFKPYIAPALSSGCVSILNLLRGKPFYGAIPMDGVYFGCRTRWGVCGPETTRQALLEPLPAQLRLRIERSISGLKEWEAQCRI